MRVLAGLITAGAIASICLGATAAAAKSNRLDDVGYWQLARCTGLASSSKLGPADAAGLSSLLRVQARGRDQYVSGHADELQQQARSQADRSDGAYRDKLNAELQGPCTAFKN